MDGFRFNGPVNWDWVSDSINLPKMYIAQKLATAFTTKTETSYETQECIKDLQTLSYKDLLLRTIITCIITADLLAEFSDHVTSEPAMEDLVDAIELQEDLQYNQFFKGVKLNFVDPKTI